MTHICKYCGKPVLRRGKQRYHVHCKRRATRKSLRVVSDIQEPQTRNELLANNRIIKRRMLEVKCNGGEVAFIVSRTPRDNSPAAEIALRGTGISASQYSASESIYEVRPEQPERESCCDHWACQQDVAIP